MKINKTTFFFSLLFLSFLFSNIVLATEVGQTAAICKCDVTYAFVAGAEPPTTVTSKDSFNFEMGEDVTHVYWIKPGSQQKQVNISTSVKPSCSDCESGFSANLKTAIDKSLKAGGDSSAYSLVENCKKNECTWKKLNNLPNTESWQDCKSLSDGGGSVTWNQDFEDLKINKLDPETPIELKVDNQTVVSFACTSGCENIVLEDDPPPSSSGKLTIKNSQVKPGPYSVEIQATPGAGLCEGTGGGAKKTINYTITLNCADLLVGLDCTKTPKVCVNDCKNKSKEYCYYNGSQCVEAKEATNINQWDKTEQTQYYQGLYQSPPGYAESGGAMPPCAFSGTCRNVNDLVQLIVNFGAGMFAIIGSFAFAFFVYGGFTIVTSFGNAERVKKGKDIMVAAVVGMIIAISAYLLVEVLLDALKVAPAFRGI